MALALCSVVQVNSHPRGWYTRKLEVVLRPRRCSGLEPNPNGVFAYLSETIGLGIGPFLMLYGYRKYMFVDSLIGLLPIVFTILVWIKFEELL